MLRPVQSCWWQGIVPEGVDVAVKEYLINRVLGYNLFEGFRLLWLVKSCAQSQIVGARIVCASEQAGHEQSLAREFVVDP